MWDGGTIVVFVKEGGRIVLDRNEMERRANNASRLDTHA